MCVGRGGTIHIKFVSKQIQTQLFNPLVYRSKSKIKHRSGMGGGWGHYPHFKQIGGGGGGGGGSTCLWCPPLSTTYDSPSHDIIPCTLLIFIHSIPFGTSVMCLNN